MTAHHYHHHQLHPWSILVLLLWLVQGATPLSFVPSSSSSLLSTRTAPSYLRSSSSVVDTTALTMTTSVSELARSLHRLSPAALSELAVATPPCAYLLALLSAGVGMPVSEDALCMVVGSILPAVSPAKRWRLIGSCYVGVVLSDLTTFCVGRALRRGLLEPVRRRLKLGSDGTTTTTDDDDTVAPPTRRRKRDRIKAKMEQAGDYVGFVVRLSVGMRGPLMLLTGFTDRVSSWKFCLGVMAGALVSLPVQLLVGYTMSRSVGQNIVRAQAAGTTTSGVLTTAVSKTQALGATAVVGVAVTTVLLTALWRKNETTRSGER